ncbi:MAG: hypothetical protein SGI71_03950 [Verrucomicrobiota bacterium]|nr:hypothetical protein [Verrucomicrobiota bacterium]
MATKKKKVTASIKTTTSTRKAAPLKKKTTAKKKESARDPKAYDAAAKKAMNLIDTASQLLKQGISMGSKQGAKGRAAVKKKAYDAINSTAKVLGGAVREGAIAAHNSIKKM